MGGFVGGAFATAVYLVYTELKIRKIKRQVAEETKQMQDEIEKLLLSKATNAAHFQKGDFLKSKDAKLQPWETTPPPSITAEVLEVGDGAYLLHMSVPGHGSGSVTVTFAEAHYTFIKDESRRPKTVLKLVKEEVQ